MNSNIEALKEVIFTCKLTADTKSFAFDVAYKLLGEDFTYDNSRSLRAGYPIFYCQSGAYVCDLDTRLEINFSNGMTKNIWINI